MLPPGTSNSGRLADDHPTKKIRNGEFNSRGTSLRDLELSTDPPVRKNKPQNSTDVVVSRALGGAECQSDHLKQLPDEILLQIAASLRETHGLSGLSRVNKHMNAVANEAMAKTLVVPESKLKQAIVWLSKHPDLMHRVNAVEVIGPHRVAHTHSLDIRPHFHIEVEKVLFNTILANHHDRRTWEQIELDDEGSPPLDTYVALITLLCPNIKAVSLPLGIQKSFAGIQDFLPIPSAPLTSPSKNAYFTPATLFHPRVLPILHDELESLTLTQCRGWAGPVQDEVICSAMQSRMRTIGRVPITLRGFKRLRHLDVPMDILGLPHSVMFKLPGERNNVKWAKVEAKAEAGVSPRPVLLPVKIIPLTLETLQLRGCTNRTFMFLEIIGSTPPHKSSFKHIDLYVPTTDVRDFLLSCKLADVGQSDYPATMLGLSDRGINVRFFIGTDEKLVDMCHELINMDGLDENRIGVMPSTGRQYSAISTAAMDRAGHSGSRIEHKLFMRHAASHFDLLNSASFVAEKWTQVALFSGEEIIRRDPGNRDIAFANEPRAGARPFPKRRAAGIFNLARFKFNFEKAIPARASSAGCGPVEALTRGMQGLNITTKASISYKRRLRALKSEAGRLHVRSGSPTEAGTMSEHKSTNFLVENWRSVDWKRCLQPLGMRKTREGHARHAA